jgi:methylenetetrahydrofolate dehydrogenase (NADP+)/methenyltetrahydrofolate cyclohydrolase
MQIIDGKFSATQIKEKIKIRATAFLEKAGRKPHLAAVLVGNDGASMTYVGAKIKACEEVGFESTLVELPENISEKALLSEIVKLNNNTELDGYIVQLPLPEHINETAITLAVSPEKDVDGFHPMNLGKMMLGLPTFLPATPFGITMLFEQYGIETKGKKCLIIGRSMIVGTPLALLLSRNSPYGNATVTLAHSRTQNLEKIAREADIIIAALGKPEFLKADMVKEGAVVIDVGITRVADASKKSGFTLKGDVDYANVAPKTSFITPVPGGVGPMTIVALLQNTLLAAERKYS